MTTAAWSTRVRHDTDAMFREWGSEFSGKLAAVGLVQTADTGQINWTTVTRPGAANTDAGYEIWRFNDAMQSTAPIFLRIAYGNGPSTTGTRISIQVGTSTNGAGVLGGLTTVANVCSACTATLSADTLRNSYMCHCEGFFGFCFKQSAGSNAEGMFLLARTVDGSGVPDTLGAMVFWITIANSTIAQSLRFAATAQAFTQVSGLAANIGVCLWPMSRTTSVVGADPQVGLAFTVTPRVQPVLGICGVLDVEFVSGNTFSATLIGSTSHTYIAMTTSYVLLEAKGSLKIAFQWE